MNTAPRLGFLTSLDSHNLRNSTSGISPTEKHHELLQESDTPSPCGEGVTKSSCTACNNAGYIRLDEHHAEQCVFCT